MITRQSREALGLFISCVGATAMLYGVVPNVLAGPLGLLFVGGAVITAILTVFLDARFGARPVKSLLGVLSVGAITFGLVYGIIWYLMSQALSGKPLLSFGSP